MLTLHLPRAGRATRRLAPFTALSLFAALQGVYAQTAAQTTTTETTLREVQVRSEQEKETATGPVIGYRAKRASTATKTDTPLSETPQAVTVVTSQQMADQGAANLQDALGYAAGVRSDAYGLDSRTDSVRVRGSNPDNYLDGLREAYGYYTSRTRADPYTLERLEVLRGPSGMLFGAGTAAGVINMVSKRPQAETQREVGVQYASYGRKQFQLDLTGPLTQDGEWLYRLVALKRNSDTQVAFVPDDRSLVAPSLTWRPSAATSLTLQALWQKDKSGSTSQFFPWEGTLLPNPNGRLPTSRFIGEPGDYYNSERKTLGWLFEHKFNDSWTVRQSFRISSNENDNRYHYGDFFTSPGSWASDPVGKRLLGRVNDSSLTRSRITALDNHAEGRFSTGALQHMLLFGADFARNRENVSSGSTYSEIDAYAPVYGNLQIPDRAALPRTTQRQTGLYLQDQIKLDHWIVTAGLRHDKAVAGAEGRPDEESTATTKRLGLLYAFPSGWSPYVSYSESFTPQAAIKGQLFKPLRGEQWELGLKYEPADRALAFSAALYDLREKNQIASPLPDVYSQVGATRTKGVELEVKGPLTPNLELVAHYNYTELDKQLEGLPKHQASAWAKYRFSIAGVNGFSAGAGVRWMGAFNDQQGGGNGPQIPSAALLDLMFAYDTAHWRYAVNINNATDKTYFSTCLARGDCWYGARRNVVASATYRF
ncbi:TonB-dependent siderophore receptor [Polaromonas sp. YR568]|uniref:TonB-dependent siderophore receptor n=1 Tax=Polaromonas sp. YR568 TaxID=1855301 RepID=UPI00398BBF70